jgi:lipid-A-disaccharide synthase
MAALKRAAGGPVSFAGIGGDRMTAEGLNSLFPLSDLSVMGVAEVVPHLARLLRRMTETVDAIEAAGPDVIVTIDAPAFCFRVLKRLRGFPAIKVHFVAPTVWAWRPWRARRIAPLVDHLMALLPFEPPYFEAVGLPATFVGHPVLESDIAAADGNRFRRDHGMEPEIRLLCLLPGSRRGEIGYLLPPFKEAVHLLKETVPDLRIVVPTIAGLARTLRAEFRNWPAPVSVVEGEAEKFAAMAAADVALAASGTVALELALMDVPNVIAYRVHPLTAAIVRRLIRVKYANLVNLLIDREAVPEFIQADCRGDLLCRAVGKLLTDREAADAQRAAMREAMSLLSPGEETPSDRAAMTILNLVGDRKAMAPAAE